MTEAEPNRAKLRKLTIDLSDLLTSILDESDPHPTLIDYLTKAETLLTESLDLLHPSSPPILPPLPTASKPSSSPLGDDEALPPPLGIFCRCGNLICPFCHTPEVTYPQDSMGEICPACHGAITDTISKKTVRFNIRALRVDNHSHCLKCDRWFPTELHPDFTITFELKEE